MQVSGKMYIYHTQMNAGKKRKYMHIPMRKTANTHIARKDREPISILGAVSSLYICGSGFSYFLDSVEAFVSVLNRTVMRPPPYSKFTCIRITGGGVGSSGGNSTLRGKTTFQNTYVRDSL